MVKLSNQETAVLKLMAKGLKNNPIAEELKISNKSVSTYVARLRDKLKIKKEMNTHYLIEKAKSHGLLQD